MAYLWPTPLLNIGETEGGNIVHNFYTCCGNKDQDSKGASQLQMSGIISYIPHFLL